MELNKNIIDQQVFFIKIARNDRIIKDLKNKIIFTTNYTNKNLIKFKIELYN